MKLSFATALTFFLSPAIALAMPQTFKGLVDSFYGILSGLVPLIVALAVVFFLYGVQKYILAGASEEKVKEGRNMMIYGIIGLFVMVSVWGLVRLVTLTFFQGEAPGFNASGQQGDGNFDFGD